MKKTNYQRELTLAAPCKTGSRGADVRKIQEWLTLLAPTYPQTALATTVDGAFGPATAQAVRNFQQVSNVPDDGVVSAAVFERLVSPLAKAFAASNSASTIREAVLQTAKSHLQNRPAELQYGGQQNLGPWVRSYCDGQDGTAYRWCMGFVQAVLDQAASGFGRDFTKLMPRSLSCDVVAMAGRQASRLLPNATIRKEPGRVQPGDVFLLRQPTANDWFHTGIITHVVGDTIETIEGNTDAGGSSNGTSVLAKTRNIQKSVIDVFVIDAL